MTTKPDQWTVALGERGVVRIFTTDLEPKGDAAITPRNVERLLGTGVALDPKKVEIFPARMIESLGLPHYLREGYGIPEDDMAGKAAVLEALSGLVILIPSSAFQGREAVLDPNPGLRFVAAFSEEAPAPPVRMARSAAAEGAIPPAARPGDVRKAQVQVRSWLIALGALILAAAVVLVLAS